MSKGGYYGIDIFSVELRIIQDMKLDLMRVKILRYVLQVKEYRSVIFRGKSELGSYAQFHCIGTDIGIQPEVFLLFKLNLIP